jgi:hypothetical protein
VSLPIASQQTEQESAFPVAVLGHPPKFMREELDSLEYLDQFTRYLQLTNVPMSVRMSLLALHLPTDVYKTAEGLVAPQVSPFPIVSYRLFSINIILQNV